MTTIAAPTVPEAQRTALSIILCVSGAHLLNDLLQFLLPALYPLLKENYGLSYFQIGMLTLGQQITACLLQPIFGLSGDLKPKPYWLALSMAIVAAGVAMLAAANGFWLPFFASIVMGTGSAIFHPEASRVARMASGGKLGFAQSLFQVGGNVGTALGPLAAALIPNPDLLFLDEPFEGVDAVASRVLRDTLKQVVGRGATVFLTSHVLEIVEKLCTHVGIIVKGSLVEQCSLEELRRGSSLESRFLEKAGADPEAAGKLSWLEEGAP